mgnify:CR=1 FL=1
MRNLRTFYNPDPEKTLQNKEHTAAITASLYELYNFQEAWWHKDLMERAKWRTAIKKEIRDMISKGVWKKINSKGIPSERRLVRNKWGFKAKRCGKCRADLCALGYTQIHGEYFTDNFALVIKDETFRMVPALAVSNN